MKPFVALQLEQLIERPGMYSSSVVAAAAYQARSEIIRLENALTGIMRGAPDGSHAKLTAAAALDLIGEDGRIKKEQ
jgi:hypothetical protein